MSVDDCQLDELMSRLQESEGRLAAALSQNSELQERERVVTTENIQLQERVKALESTVNGVRGSKDGRASLDGSVSASSPSKEGRPPLPRSRSTESIPSTSGDGSVGLATAQNEHVLYLRTRTRGLVPATVVATSGSLEFKELSAKITPPEFVGMRLVPPNGTRNGQAGSGGAVDGSTKYYGGGILSSAPPEKMTMLPNKLTSSLRALNLHRGAGRPGSAGGSGSGASGIGGGGGGGQDDDARSDPGSWTPNGNNDLVKNHSWGGNEPDPLADPAAGGEGAAAGGLSVAEVAAEGQTCMWEILWKDGGGGGPLKRLTFEAPVSVQSYLKSQVENWSEEAGHAKASSIAANAAPGGIPSPPSVKLPPPVPLVEGAFMPRCSEPSAVLTKQHVMALCAALPKRHKQDRWTLRYSTVRHGISLQTLYRKVQGVAPSVLVVKDRQGYIFGAFSSEPWKVSPRYYGTGESFVFQLYPNMHQYTWKRTNNYFMYGSGDSLAVGGGGHFALWVDNDLHYGNSGVCETYGSPCLAGSEEFRCMQLEGALKDATRVANEERRLRTQTQMELQQSLLSGGTSNALNLLKGGGMSVPYPLTPIGTLRSCFSKRKGTPLQPLLAPSARAELALRAGVSADALNGLENFSHCWLVYVFHDNTDLNRLWEPQGGHGAVRTQVDVSGGGQMGVLATRARHRPSPIGLSVARVVGVHGSSLLLEGADVVDGSPILDVKPYIPSCDTVPRATAPHWAPPPMPGASGLPQEPVSFTPVGKAQLLDAWWAVHTGEQGSLYHSAAEFADLVTQVLTLETLRLERHRQHLNESGEAGGEGGGEEGGGGGGGGGGMHHVASASSIDSGYSGAGYGEASARPEFNPHTVHSVVLEDVEIQYMEVSSGRVVVTGCRLTKGGEPVYPELDREGSGSAAAASGAMGTGSRRPSRRGSV